MTRIHDSSNSDLEKLILDTHVLIWYVEGIKLNIRQVELIDKARNEGSLFVSAISIWEISMLVGKGKLACSVNLSEWINNILSIPGLNIIDLSIPILVESCNLPNYEHRDPADRLIIASSRSTNSHLMTFDQKIIDYANHGYLKIIRNN